MDNDLLRKNLNNLEEYKRLKRYLTSGYDGDYKIKIKRKEMSFDGWFTTKRNMNISRDVLVGIVDSKIERLKDMIEKLKTGELE